MGAEDRLAELGLDLPPTPTALASYVPVVVSNGFAFAAGQVPLADGALMWTGLLGRDLDAETGAPLWQHWAPGGELLPREPSGRCHPFFHAGASGVVDGGMLQMGPQAGSHLTSPAWRQA